MKVSDLIAGSALFVGGCVLYYTNYKGTDDPAKRRTRVGLGLMVAGAMLATGEWMTNLVFSGR